MMLLRAIVFSTVLLLVFGGTSAAEDVQKAAEGMLDRARQLSDIRSPNAPGFRLNVTFSFIEQDLETLQGTYTEVWISNSQWRRETVVGNFRRAEIGGPDKYWMVDGGKDFPEEAARVSTLVNVFPTKAAKFEFESITSPNPATQCALTKAVGEKHQRHAFCFDKDKQVLLRNIAPQVVGERIADYSCDYRQFRKFGDYWFPREMACFEDGHRKMEAKVVGLSPASSPDAALFTPPAGALEMGNCSQTPVAAEALSTPELPSKVPRSQRGDHRHSVVVWMVIGTNGKPRDLRITRSGGKEFDDTALATVRGWRFKPGTCNGEPTAVSTSVEMTFWGYQ